MTVEQIEAVFSERRKQQDAINLEIDAALASNDIEKLKESLNNLVSAFNEPIKFI